MQAARIGNSRFGKDCRARQKNDSLVFTRHGSMRRHDDATKRLSSATWPFSQKSKRVALVVGSFSGDL